ncbi:MAG: hypothetical protein K9N51_03045, partial [Candidatus Pacebacteria bacterium]|nr:hypothetical protein [Candidatus Paceibacterota bacterium]
ELNRHYLSRWKVYYLFQKTIPASVHTCLEERGPRMDLRVQRENVWMEFSILLPGDGPFVVFECTGRSHPSLQAHARQILPVPMLYITGAGGTIAARNRRESHTYATLVRYLFAWRPDHETIYGLLSTQTEQQQRTQWPPGGYRSVYVNMPHILWCADQPPPRDPNRLQDYGEALWLQAQWQLPGRLAQPKDAEP